MNARRICDSEYREAVVDGVLFGLLASVPAVCGTFIGAGVALLGLRFLLSALA